MFLDHYLKGISYPTDFLAHEPVAIVIAEMILELAMQIKLSDDYSKWTLLEPTERPETTQLLMTIFEVGDFTFFRNLFYNYMSKLPLVNFNTYNSGVISGKAVNMFLEFSLDKNSPFKTYNKKFNSILIQNLEYIMKLIINMHAIEIDKEIISHNIKITKPVGLARILLVETLYLMIYSDCRNSYTILDKIHETCWDAIITWLLDKEYNFLFDLK